MSVSYQDLINVPTFGKKRESTFEEDRGELAFWCRNCEKIVEAVHLPPAKIKKKMRKNRYSCPECRGEHISISSEAGLRDKYKIK